MSFCVQILLTFQKASTIYYPFNNIKTVFIYKLFFHAYNNNFSIVERILNYIIFLPNLVLILEQINIISTIFLHSLYFSLQKPIYNYLNLPFLVILLLCSSCLGLIILTSLFLITLPA